MVSRISELESGAIGTGSGGPVEAVRPGNAVGAAGTGGGSSTGTAPSDVHITDSARALASLSQSVQDAPEVDAARVASLQQALSSGQYSIDPERIAGSMLQLEQELAGTRQQ